MRRRLIPLFGLFLVSAHVHAADCASFETAIDKSLKVIAVADVALTTDDSNLRVATRTTEINNQLLLIQLNLTLMIQNRCPTPLQPISLTRYFVAAAKCAKAASPGAPECARKTWAPTD